MKTSNVSEVVNSFKTKYKEGFTQGEIKELLDEYYPEINMDKFNDALMGITCMMIDNKMIIYHCDIITAVNCAIENRNMKSYEFD